MSGAMDMVLGNGHGYPGLYPKQRRLVLNNANTFGKYMHSTILPPSMGTQKSILIMVRQPV